MIGHRQTVRRGPTLLAAAIIVSSLIILSGCDLSRPTPRPAAQPSPTLPSAPPAAGTPAFESASARVIAPTPDMVPGEILIKLNQEPALRALNAVPQTDGIVATGEPGLDNLNRQFGVKVFDPLIKPLAGSRGETIQSFVARQPDLLGTYVVSFDPQNDPQAVASAYRAEPSVIFAEPNYYAYANDRPVTPLGFTPNDLYFSFQWDMPLVQAPQAWDVSTGAGVVVAVLDTGIAYEDYDVYKRAPDLSNTNFVQGYDFINNDAHANDDEGHGTHVAGTIAQSTNNSQGVAGVAFNATLMPIKVLDDRGQGSYAAIAQGIMYATDRGARVINMSLSGRSGSNVLAEALDYAVRKGALVVVAAGNSGGSVEYPAAYDTALAVGSVGYNRVRVDYSNFGSQIDLVAPGGDTDSDLNKDGYPDGILQETFRGGDVTNFGFYFYEGTSMAAPHVSGVAALLFARNPNATASQVREAMETTALDLGQAGRDNEYGLGLVQAASALAVIGGPPQPTPTPTPEPTATLPPGTTPTPTVPGGDTPTPTSSPIPSEPTATPGPPAGDLIINGAFESDTGWTFGKTHYPAGYSTDVIHGGTRAARLGIVDGVDRYSYSSIWQSVTIPADATRATLTYWIYPQSDDAYPADLQLVLLLNERFQVLDYLHRELSNSRQWTQQSHDLTPFIGRTVTVYFGVVNRGSNGKTSAMYVDDVALTFER